MSLIQIFSNEINIENNTINLFIENNFKLINIKKEIFLSIDKNNVLKNNNLFCYIKVDNELFLNVNIYIKGKPYNFNNFYLIKNFYQKIENLKINFENFENIKNNKNMLQNYINTQKTILNEFLNDLNIDLNIDLNLEIDHIFKIKKYIIHHGTNKIFLEINNFMEYFFDNEQINLSKNTHITRLISNDPVEDEKTYKDFLEIFNKNKININEEINKLYFYV